MKVLPFTIPKPTQDALILQEDKVQLFYGQLHQHKEIQISLIKQGQGSLIVGDSIRYYKQGDVFILGSNIPHVFKSDLDQHTKSHMLSIFFTEDSFGTQFFSTEELKPLTSFFTKAQSGFKIENNIIKIKALFDAIETATKIDRFVLFIQLLKSLNNARFTLLSSFGTKQRYSETDGKRMQAVFDYAMNHFNEPISLEHIAKEAAMTKTAFCKYFKKRTRKTFITFLNELRVEAASKQLIEAPDKSIASIAELSGFQNISNFNRNFLRIKGVNPRAFRRANT